MNLTTRQKNKLDTNIEEIVRRRCSGWQISVMDISKVFRAGYAAHEAARSIEDAVVAAYSALRTDKAS